MKGMEEVCLRWSRAIRNNLRVRAAHINGIQRIIRLSTTQGQLSYLVNMSAFCYELSSRFLRDLQLIAPCAKSASPVFDAASRGLDFSL